MTKKILINTISELETFAKEFLQNIDTNIVLLNGEIGAGKTTFVNSIIKAMGVVDKISSPTFSIINTYRLINKTIYHIDLYRLENIYELEMTGFYDILSENELMFIEWADKFDLTQDLNTYIEININVKDDGKREFLITTNNTK